MIALDCALCPSPIKDFVDADYAHSIVEWGVAGIFDDLEYTLAGAAAFPNSSRLRVVAVSRNPVLTEFDPELGNGFRFVGFDLIDEETWISSLTNCGGFEGAFWFRGRQGPAQESDSCQSAEQDLPEPVLGCRRAGSRVVSLRCAQGN